MKRRTLVQIAGAASRWLSIAVLLLVIAGCRDSQNSLNTPRVSLGQIELMPIAKDSVEIRVEVEVRDPFHIQANPASAPYLIPTRLEIKAPFEEQHGLSYPDGEPFSLFGSPDTISVYGGRFTIRNRYKTAGNRTSSDIQVQGRLTYQACDERSCFPPSALVFERRLAWPFSLLTSKKRLGP